MWNSGNACAAEPQEWNLKVRLVAPCPSRYDGGAASLPNPKLDTPVRECFCSPPPAPHPNHQDETRRVLGLCIDGGPKTSAPGRGTSGHAKPWADAAIHGRAPRRADPPDVHTALLRWASEEAQWSGAPVARTDVQSSARETRTSQWGLRLPPSFEGIPGVALQLVRRAKPRMQWLLRLFVYLDFGYACMSDLGRLVLGATPFCAILCVARSAFRNKGRAISLDTAGSMQTMVSSDRLRNKEADSCIPLFRAAYRLESGPAGSTRPWLLVAGGITIWDPLS